VVRDPAKKRPVDFPGTITTDPDAILGDPRIDVVIELMGGIEPAKSIIIEAFRRGKHVVTANKALLSQFGREIFQAAAKYRRNIGFEASVAGEIPVIDDYLKIPSKSDVLALEGIINGTTNFILSSMMEGAEYDTALAEAQSGGFAEADPSFDVDGHDAAQKLAILSSILFHTDVDVRAISLQGITALLAVDCETARLWGYTIKPCASARRIDETLMLRVCPAFIPMGHALYSVSREMNALALYLKGREEPITKIGKGAGAIPTARSIMRDVLEVGKKVRRHVVDLPLYATSAQRLPIRDEDTLEAPFYLRFSVDDTPGVFGRVATILGDWDLSISQAHQREKQKDEPWSHILLQVKRTTLGKVKGAFSLIAREPFAHDLLYCMILQ
jgi:homoserine dehydrogenase